MDGRYIQYGTGGTESEIIGVYIRNVFFSVVFKGSYRLLEWSPAPYPSIQPSGRQTFSG